MNGIEFRIKGKVQGVGFRPYIWNIAKQLDLNGEVLNDGKGVLIRLQKSDKQDQFHALIIERCPPLAQITAITISAYHWSRLPHSFAIVQSQHAPMDTHIIPDAATCSVCLAELYDTKDRRYQYPFINCTHCGPRFTIINAMPYDRPLTVMADFPFCKCCFSEYQHPADRRFHAQPVACFDCGPQLWVTDNRGHKLVGKWLDIAKQALLDGKIVAIKSVGGFHFACDAKNQQAIQTLRLRKARPSKPFALMMVDSEMVNAFAFITKFEQQQLVSSHAPIILLLPKKRDLPLHLLAPERQEIGIMLPSNPLQHLLIKHFDSPLVMTSANANGHPPVLDNESALTELGVFADLFILHDRKIVQRCDDSVIRIDKESREIEMLRRARGYAPDAISLPDDFPDASGYIAYGGDLKSAFAIGQGREVIVSQYLGDLSNIETQKQYIQTIDKFKSLYQLKIKQHIADIHPQYFTHLFAKKQTDNLITVAHHHAHVAACLVENGWQQKQGKVLALTLDGVGMSDRGELWGGELLLADYQSCKKLGGLPAVALPGGDRAATEPWRMLFSHLHQFADNFLSSELQTKFKKKPVSLLKKAIEQKINSPLCSSTGRLFDAVAASLGICFDNIEYEGQAACILEAWAKQALDRHELDKRATLPELVIETEGYLIDLKSFWNSWMILDTDKYSKALLFHKALAKALCDIAERGVTEHHVTHLVLTGGVFHNQLLRRFVKDHFKDGTKKITIFEHHQFSYGDGALALGQIAIGLSQH
jgi:hydrogenase maturation protein HypF